MHEVASKNVGAVVVTARSKASSKYDSQARCRDQSRS